MKKVNYKLLFALTCVGALCLGVGFMMGSAYTVHETIRGLEYVDNLEINVDMNETHMVEAMMPYILAEQDAQMNKK